MEKFNSIDKIAKIATGVPGFDDLFFGGLRLPDYGKGIIEEGLCIIISGNRSVGKSCLAMQIMRGVDIYLKGNGLSPKYKSLNFLEEELRKRYVSLEVSKWIDNARLPIGNIEDECKFCQLFPGTKEKLGEFIYSDEDKMTKKGDRYDAYFKPDFAPDTLRCQNYICHFSIFKKEVFRIFSDKKMIFSLFVLPVLFVICRTPLCICSGVPIFPSMIMSFAFIELSNIIDELFESIASCPISKFPLSLTTSR